MNTSLTVTKCAFVALALTSATAANAVSITLPTLSYPGADTEWGCTFNGQCVVDQPEPETKG